MHFDPSMSVRRYRLFDLLERPSCWVLLLKTCRLRVCQTPGSQSGAIEASKS